jgi:hypothetical protein
MRLGLVATAATYGAVPLSDELKADVVGYCSMARRTHWAALEGLRTAL